MKLYTHQAKIDQSVFTRFDIKEEDIIRQQIQELIKIIPIDDLTKIIKVKSERNTRYLTEDELTITVSINI